MKRYFLLIAGLYFCAGCKKEQVLSPEYAQAYTRFVMVDAPGSGKLQFYLDGKINANGDSVIYNPDGSLYLPDPSIATTSLVNYPSGGWTDNSPVSFSGTYGNYYAPASAYADFPNPTDRIPLAPIVKGYNYFNWASLPAGSHQASFYGVVSASLYGNQVFAKGSNFLDQSVSLEGGALQTFFVVNEAPCKTYQPSGINTPAGLPIYSVNEQLDFYGNQFGLMAVKDHPSKLPVFNDSSAYVRFVNCTPTYMDQALNTNTASLDIYLAPIFGSKPNYYNLYQGITINTIDSAGQEFLVAKDLARFASSVDAPFYELNLSQQMRNLNDTAVSPGQPRIPHYYRVIAYPSGHSAATGDQPVGSGDWLAVYHSFTAINYDDPSHSIIGPRLDSWLLRSDGTNAHPAICTIPVAVSTQAVPNTIATNYMGFRSCINYIPQGANNVYFH